ncbi:Receptor-like protein 13 [Citrus sinensis]|uniref:Receptor-like protein 13 n=1 Tax=Citrus sinensis TaxID=2711 RepID=A0ACB8KH56_CITSI|nr:Receptor-like protein 13 [Citrus sinensis]
MNLCASIDGIFNNLSVPFNKVKSKSASYMAADLVSVGDSWLSFAIKNRLIEPIAGAEDQDWFKCLSHKWKVTSLSLILEPELAGRISMVNSPREVIGSVLKYRVASYNSNDIDSQVAGGKIAVQQNLALLANQVRLFDSTHYLKAFAIGDVWVAVGWISDVLPTVKHMSNVAVVVPKSGASCLPFYFDIHIVISFILAITRFLPCKQEVIPGASPSALESTLVKLPEELLEGKPSLDTNLIAGVLPAEILARCEFLEPLSEATLFYEKRKMSVCLNKVVANLAEFGKKDHGANATDFFIILASIVEVSSFEAVYAYAFSLLYYLYDWADDEGATDCCQWERVECSNTTGRVTALDLSDTYSGEYGWYLNASLFTSFQQLESLDFSLNKIAGCDENEGLERLSRLNNLKMLNLSYNWFNNSILSSLTRLSSLRSLKLYANNLEGSIDVKEFDSLRDLEELDIGWNMIDKFVVSKGLSKLKSLGLAGIKLNRSILSSLTVFSSLRELHLRDTGFKGTFDVREFDSFNNLEVLDLSWNEIDNLVVPQGYKGLRKLKSLDLSGVGIRDGSKLLQSMGSFPSLNTLHLLLNNFNNIATATQELHTFTNLEYLTLDHSSLHISLLQSIASIFPSLKDLSMFDCKVNGLVRGQGFPHFKSLDHLDMVFARTALNTSFLQIIRESMPSLKYLSMSDSTLGTNSSRILDQGLCSLMHLQELYIDNNDLRGSLPWCLANMTSLRILDVSSNQLTGSISSSPLVHLTSIEELMLSNNHFQIPISLEPLFNHSRLKIFDAANNEIKAEITESHSLTAPNFQLQALSLSSGYGDGVTFPKFLYHQHDLEDVRLSHVNMDGEFPNWLLENNTKLRQLYLVNDSLTGPFRLPIHSHRWLRFLDVSNNNFQGHIPVEIGDILPSLISFNISMNALDSSIPSSFGNMNFLQILDLSNNQLTGEIPEHLAVSCVNLEFLALSNNNLKGHMFSRNFNLTNLRSLQLEGNHLEGEIPQSLSKCSSLEGLYLNNNSLSGKIPRWLGNLTGLKHIIMPENHLEGPIPVGFCQLYSLQILDISDNNISGSLPSCFHPLSIEQVHLSKNMLHGQLKRGTFFHCSSLVTLDLSYNRLNGSIPNWVDGLSQLSHLILGHNNLEGEVPVQLCELNQLQLLDLSNNNLHGPIPPCFDNTTLHESSNNSYSLKPFETSLVMDSMMIPAEKQIHENFEFTTKNIAYIYQGKVLSLLSGLDLSCNKLIGHIPPQIGNLTRIQTLNLSHNNLTGLIPSTFSNLKHIESLDLSYNKLNGKIPHQLVELKTLAVFSVAYNNLSGEIPEWTAQFATFNESSYEGNTFLCGLPLPICRSPATMSEASIGNERDDNLIDIDSFFITFTTSYVVVIFGIVIVLYVNSYWRRKWFYFVEMWITSCYYFVVDNLIPTRFCH